MKYSSDNLIIRLFWYDNPLSWSEFVSSTKNIINKIRPLIPGVTGLEISEDPQKHDVMIKDDLSNIEEKLLIDFDYDRKFINENPNDGSFGQNSRWWYGFHAGWAFLCADEEKEIWASYHDGVKQRLNVKGDIVHGQNSFILRIDPKFNHVIVINILRTCIDMLNPSYAYAGRMSASEHLHQPVGDNWIGWLTYLRDGEKAPEYLPDDVKTERLGKGVLIWADEEPCQADDVAGVEKLWRIYSALEPHGFLKRIKP